MKFPSWLRSPAGRIKSADDQLTLTEHLAELRVRIIRSGLAVAAGMIVIVVWYDPVLRFLSRPYQNLCDDREDLAATCNFVSLGPLDAFGTRFRIAMWGGLVLALPVILWQIWRFVVPALHAKEKKYAIPFILSTVVMFLLGCVLAYWTFEKALEFLIDWSGEDVIATYQVSQVRQPRHADDGDVRHRLPVARAARVPAARRGAQTADADQVVALRDHDDLRARRGDHTEWRPDLDAGARDPADASCTSSPP